MLLITYITISSKLVRWPHVW